jgi:voltage-gated potassium channel
MKNTWGKKIAKLPFVTIENKIVAKKLHNRRFAKIIVDILDGDLWSSKVSFFGNIILIFIIILSSAEVVLSSDASLNNYSLQFEIVHIITSVFFLLEIVSRISYAHFIHPEYSRTKSVLMYIFSFYGIIDILSIVPFCTEIFGIHSLHFLAILRIFRVWRIARYIPAFSSITNAFRSKRDEILVTLIGVVLLSISLSAFIYYAELGKGASAFRSITDVFIWSIGKYTGDYGAIADATPVTIVGKFLATLNGFLGLALFAVPAGLLGSAFIDELSEQKHIKIINQRIEEINNHFDIGYKTKSQLGNKKTNYRYLSYEALQSRLMFSDDEILECVRTSDNLRFRPMKSNDNLKFSDIKVIEKFLKNTSYGSKIINKNSNVYIINPSGAIERGISHFTHTIVDNLGYNFISREVRLVDKNKEVIGSNLSKHYSNFDYNNTQGYSSDFSDFMLDIHAIKKEDFVIVIGSSASNKGDFILEYGNQKDTEDVIQGTSTIDSIETINTIKDYFSINTEKAKHLNENSGTFIFENHTIGNFEEDWIGKSIRRDTGANVITLYLNINILTGEDNRYFSGLNIVLDSFENTFGNHKSINLS